MIHINVYLRIVLLFFFLGVFPVSGIMCVAQAQSDEAKFKEYLRKAQTGDAEAQLEVAYCYYDGIGVSQSYEKAVYWVTKAANQGNAKAQSNLGISYEQGQGVSQSYVKAVEWYTKAANQGYAEAQLWLGCCYEFGQGVSQSYVKAVEWYTKAANQGYAGAQYKLGNCYYFGQGVSQSYVKAVEWYTKAANQGYAGAQSNLGVCYEQGQGVSQDYSKAVELYTKAVNQGDDGAQYNLGVCYEFGIGVSQSYDKAVELYTKSAEQGYAKAQYNLGVCFTEGKGVSQSYTKAVEWYTKAAEQGYARAQYNLGLSYKRGEGVPQSDVKAAEWFAKAAEQGDEAICLYEFNSLKEEKNVQPVQKLAPKPEVVQQKPVEENTNIDTDIPTVSGGNDRTFAVIIGNENYQLVSHVDYALNDVKTFAVYCKKTLGLPERNIRIYSDATFGTMLVALKDIKDIADAYNGNINVLFYYAGHGIPDGKGNAYLLPVDADGTQTEACLPTSKLYQKLNDLKANKVVVFMDACFSGAQRGDGMLIAARGVAIKSVSEAPKGNCVVFSATNGEETAFPYKEMGHGMFTYFLLKKLRDTKGDVSLGELAEYIKTQVGTQSVVVNRKKQTPTVIPSQAVVNSWQSMKLK